MVKTTSTVSSSNDTAAARHDHHRVTKSADSSSSSSSCKYTGVRKRKWGKFVSEIRLPNSRERIWLGSYDSAVKAARAFDAALYCLRGPAAKFNFPDNPPEIPGGRSLTPAQIQVEAARFAHSGSRVVSDHDSSSSSGSDELQHVDSPSVSDGATQVNTEAAGVDNMLLDQFKTMRWDDSNYSVSDLGYFPSFDDFQDDLFMRPMTGPVDNEVEEACDEFGSYLWSF